MKKKLDTRFPAARIKRIMQSDDDVGKIAMAVPLLISKALELFLQDLCDRTYEITLKRGAKTMSSSHLKHCVQSFNVFDFLKEIVSRVPDLDVSSVAAVDDQPIVKRRKLADVDNSNFGETENKMHGAGHTRGGGRRQGRGRGRGRGRRPEVDMFEDDPDMHDEMHDLHSSAHDATTVLESKCKASLDEDTKPAVRGFDLNVDLDEDGNTPSLSDYNTPSLLACEPSTTSTKLDSKMKLEEHHEWSLYEMGLGNVVLDPFQLVSMNQPLEEDEDYDREG